MRFPLACIVTAAMGAALAFANPLAVTYELQHVAPDGALYVLDYDLSRDDCAAALQALPVNYAACAAIAH